MSSYDFPRVSGIKMRPNAAVNKQIVPNIIIHPESPRQSRMAGNIVSNTNIIDHIKQSATDMHAARI